MKTSGSGGKALWPSPHLRGGGGLGERESFRIRESVPLGRSPGFYPEVSQGPSGPAP
jgi:hypothetical protein